MMPSESLRCLVGGNLVGNHQAPVLNPATEEEVGLYHVADEPMLDDAVMAATNAFSAWRKTSLAERRAVISRLADILSSNAIQLAHLLTLEQGKPLAEAKGEVVGAEAFLRYYATVPGSGPDSLFSVDGIDTLRSYAPLGVVAGIVGYSVFELLRRKL